VCKGNIENMLRTVSGICMASRPASCDEDESAGEGTLLLKVCIISVQADPEERRALFPLSLRTAPVRSFLLFFIT